MIKLYNYLVKNGDAVAVGVSAILFVIFALGIYVGTSSGGYSLNELIDREDKSDINCFNPGLWMMIIMTLLAILLMVFGVFFDLFKNFIFFLRLCVFARSISRKGAEPQSLD